MKVIIILFVIIAALILLTIIISDIRNTIQYMKAEEAMAIISKNIGIEKVAFYGKSQYRNYGKYELTYYPLEQANGINEEALFKNKKLDAGDIIDVKYIKNNDGFKLLNDISMRRLAELFVVIIITIILIFVVLKYKI